MATIFDYNEKYNLPDGTKKELSNEGKYISLYNVMKLKKKGELEKSTDEKRPSKDIEWEPNEKEGKPCLVFFNKEAMKFFAIEQDDNAGLLAALKIPGLMDTLSMEEKKSFKGTEFNLDNLVPSIFKGENIEKIKKNVETLREIYETLKPDGKDKLYPTLHRVFELTADIQQPYQNYREMDNLFKDVSSTVKVPPINTKLETVKLPTADITSSSSHGSTGWSKMTGGAVSSEIASILHLLEYNNTVNNNFVNNVLPTLKGGNLNDINWELEHFITNSQNNEKLFNTITKLAKEAMSEPLKVYLNRLRFCIARALGIKKILDKNPDLLTKKDNTSVEILKKIRDKIGKYTTDLKKKEEAAKKGIHVSIEINKI